MKGIPALLLQALVVLIGLAVLSFLLFEPHLEGRNAHATFFDIYFKDPFLAYVYVGSTPFFLAIHRAFRILGDLRRSRKSTRETLEGLRLIRRCAITLLGFIAGGAVLVLVFGDREDRPAGLFMSLLFASGAGAIAVAASFLAKRVQDALDRP